MVRKRPKNRKRQRGLTLLESLVTLAIVSVLTAMAAPSFKSQIATARAKAGAQQLYAAVQFARTTAQLTGRTVMLCPITDFTAELPACGGHFGQAIAAIAMGREGSELLRIWSPPAGLTVTNRSGARWVRGALQWDSQGLGSRNLTLSVCAQEHNWSVVTNRLGRPRLASDWGVCPAVVGI